MPKMCKSCGTSTKMPPKQNIIPKKRNTQRIVRRTRP